MVADPTTGMLRQLEGLLRRRSLVVGLLKAGSRFLTIVGTIMLCGWSYAHWGSEESPMRMLWWPGIALLVCGWIVGAILGHLLRRLQRLLRTYLQGLEEDRLSRTVRRL